MNDFQTINEIVNESVRNSSYITVFISSSVFIAYTLVVRLIDYFKAKDKNKPLLEMATALKENTSNIVKLNSVLDKTLKDAEKKETNKCRMVIDLAFTSFKSKISQECEHMIIHNDIAENKQFIVDNLTKIINSEYYRLYSVLSAYEVNNINVATKLKNEWVEETTKDITDIIYNGQTAIVRISQVNTKLLVNIGTYSTYVNNKIFTT